MNLSAEAKKYFAERPHITIHVDPKGDVWEKSADPMHPDAFAGCGQAVESVMCSPEAVAKAGPRRDVWLLLDYWGNPIGDDFGSDYVDLKNLGDGWLLKRFKKVARRFHVARPELLPMEVLSEVSKVFGVGADKYSRDDWAKPDNGGGDHLAAAERHLAKFKDGNVVEGGENGSGLHHIDHAIARLMMLRGKALRNG